MTNGELPYEVRKNSNVINPNPVETFKVPMTHDEQNNSSDTGTKVPVTHDELLAKILDNYWIDKPQESLGYSSPDAWAALRAVVELTNNLQDTESWQDNAEYNAGYNNAMYEIIQAIKKELK